MTRRVSLTTLATLTLLSAVPVAAQDITLPLTARGNEPFWSVEATADGLRLSEPEGKGTVQPLSFTPATENGSLILTTKGSDVGVVALAGNSRFTDAVTSTSFGDLSSVAEIVA